VAARGERLRAGLREALAGNAHVKEVRGQGLICGVQLDVVRPGRMPWCHAAA
jgi:4-aminobutyrate aminotransferase-like enzyme